MERDTVLGYLLLGPAVVILALLLGWPLIEAIALSFYNMHPLTRETSFVGFGNYVSVFRDPEFWNAFKLNFIWLGGVLTLQIILGVAIALLLNVAFYGRGIARTLVLFPYLLPVIVAALVWQWMLEPLHGIVNHWFESVGLETREWFGAIPDAMIAVIFVGSWKLFPFVVLAVLARLQSIPAQLYEAAAVDGASAWSRFWDITVPQLRSVLFVVILLRAIWDFREFDLIFLLTGGGPLGSTTTLPLLVYKEAFETFRMGRALAISVVMLLVMMVFIASYFQLLRRSNAMNERA